MVWDVMLEPPYGSTEGALKDKQPVRWRLFEASEPPYGSTEGALKDPTRSTRMNAERLNHHTALQREH